MYVTNFSALTAVHSNRLTVFSSGVFLLNNAFNKPQISMLRLLTPRRFFKRITSNYRRISAFNRCSYRFSYRFYTAPTFISTDRVIELFNDKKTEKKDIIFVDVRPPETFQLGAIGGAINIHDVFTYLLPESTESDLGTMKSHFTELFIKNDILCKDNEHVIIYEDGLNKLYGSSCRGYFIFKYMGHPHVSVLEGGYQGVLKLDENKRQQLKTTKGSDSNKKVEKETGFKHNDKWMCGYQDVMNVLSGKRKAHLLDVRDAPECYVIDCVHPIQYIYTIL